MPGYAHSNRRTWLEVLAADQVGAHVASLQFFADLAVEMVVEGRGAEFRRRLGHRALGPNDWHFIAGFGRRTRHSLNLWVGGGCKKSSHAQYR